MRKKYWLNPGIKDDRMGFTELIYGKLYEPNAKLPLANYNKTYTEITNIYGFHVDVVTLFCIISKKKKKVKCF